MCLCFATILRKQQGRFLYDKYFNFCNCLQWYVNFVPHIHANHSIHCIHRSLAGIPIFSLLPVAIFSMVAPGYCDIHTNNNIHILYGLKISISCCLSDGKVLMYPNRTVKNINTSACSSTASKTD